MKRLMPLSSLATLLLSVAGIGACSPDVGAKKTCTLDAEYVYGYRGYGPVAASDQVTLTPPMSYVLASSAFPGNNLGHSGSCSPAFPTCGDNILPDVSDIMNDLADPAIQELLSRQEFAPPVLGYDNRGADGTIFSFTRSNDGAGFLVGSACDHACTPIPPSVTSLVSHLLALNMVQRQDPSCRALTTGP